MTTNCSPIARFRVWYIFSFMCSFFPKQELRREISIEMEKRKKRRKYQRGKRWGDIEEGLLCCINAWNDQELVKWFWNYDLELKAIGRKGWRVLGVGGFTEMGKVRLERCCKVGKLGELTLDSAKSPPFNKLYAK